MNPLARVRTGGVPIKCVFPECSTTWYFNMTVDQDKTNDARRQAGWRYVQALSTPHGPVWGWSCTEDAQHLIDGDPSRPYQHTEEIIHA
jgi:hypothetical protein